MEQGVGAALGGFPDLIQQLAGGLRIVPATVQLGQGDEGGQLLFGQVNGAGTPQGVVEPLSGPIRIAQLQGGAALEAGGTDQVAFDTLDLDQPGGAVGQVAGLGGLALVEGELGAVGEDPTFGWLVV